VTIKAPGNWQPSTNLAWRPTHPVNSHPTVQQHLQQQHEVLGKQQQHKGLFPTEKNIE